MNASDEASQQKGLRMNTLQDCLAFIAMAMFIAAINFWSAGLTDLFGRLAP